MIRITVLLIGLSISCFSQEIWQERNFKLITSPEYREYLRNLKDTIITFESIEYTTCGPWLGRPACAYKFLFDGELPYKKYILGDSCVVIGEIEPNLGADIYYNWPKQAKNGWFVLLYESSKKPYLKFHYKNSVYDGSYFEYFDNGNIRKHSIYSNGKLHGVSISYSVDGIPITIKNYINGKLHHSATTYFNNRNLKSIDHYYEGQRNGKSTLYNNVGQLIHQRNYLNDKKHGQEFLRTKDSLITTNYSNGQYDGSRYFMNQDSTLINHWTYSKNILQGPYINYYESGIQREYRTKNQGEFDGDWLVYDSTGVIIMKSNYSEGQEQGTRNYYKGSELIAQSKYKKGVIVSTKVYDDELKKELYEFESWVNDLKLKK